MPGQSALHAADTAGGFRIARKVAPPRVVCAGRSLISRAELARLSGLAVSTLASLYSSRATNGHPGAVHVDLTHGAALYFDEEDALRWYRGRRDSGKLSARHRCAVDRHGAPDDLVGTAEAARILGYHGPATIRSYLSRFPGYFPAPDHLTPPGTGNQARRLWRRDSIWAFAEQLATSSRARQMAHR
jgi:hypothetical protein